MYFVLSDIHGSYNELVEALTHWDSNNEHLIVIGDLIDRGPDSLKVVQLLMKLQEERPDNVTVLKGNHEDMFTSWLVDTPHELLAMYYADTHRETLLSFFENDKKKFRKASRRQRAEHVVYKYKAELHFMKNVPLFHETENMIFVHAGIDLDADDWRTATKDMLWVRNTFIYAEKQAPKRVFFGHTPTMTIHRDNSSDIWINPNGDKVCMDGGLVFGGQLNALRVNHDGDITEKIAITKK